MAKVIKRNGRYVLDFYDQYKKRKRVTLQLGTTLKQAKDKLREVEEKLARGMYIPEKKIPLFKDVAKDWLEQKKMNVRPSTVKMYQSHIKHHFSTVDELKIN